MKSVGLLGGSFNPVHIGHTALAKYFVDNGVVDEVWLMVSPQNPFKQNSGLIDEKHRLAMTSLAADNLERVHVCDAELRLPKPSYTWRTLEYLTKDFPDHTFTLIIGSDNWLVFDKWAHHEEILHLYNICVYPRPGYEVAATTELPDNVRLLNSPLYDVSSTDIRSIIANGGNADKYLDADVAEYIKRHGIYTDRQKQ